MRHIGVFALVPALSLTLAACAPTSYTQQRMVWRPYDAREYRQEQDGVVVEKRDVKQLPETFYATAQACDRGGRLLIDQGGKPVLERVSLAVGGQLWEQVAITNQADRVLRLNNVVIRLLDPSGTQVEPLSRNDVAAMFLNARPCPSSKVAVQQFGGIKFIDRNMEIVPGSTASGWVAFRPPSVHMPGVWKYAFYDVPIKIDEAGRVTKVARFEMRSVARKVVDTYRRENAFAKPVLVGTREVDD